MLPYPTPPSRREGELSAEAHATGSRVECDTRDVIVGRNAEWQSRRQINHAPRVVDVLDRDTYYIPFSTERGRPCLNTLSGLRGTRRRNGARLNFPPLVIIRGFGEQIPDTLCGCLNHRDGTRANCHCHPLVCGRLPHILGRCHYIIQCSIGHDMFSNYVPPERAHGIRNGSCPGFPSWATERAFFGLIAYGAVQQAACAAIRLRIVWTSDPTCSLVAFD